MTPGVRLRVPLKEEWRLRLGLPDSCRGGDAVDYCVPPSRRGSGGGRRRLGDLGRGRTVRGRGLWSEVVRTLPSRVRGAVVLSHDLLVYFTRKGSGSTSTTRSRSLNKMEFDPTNWGPVLFFFFFL